jgi:pantothenate kinase type III
MEAGILAAVVGGVRRLADQLAARTHAAPPRFVTGGDAAFLQPLLGADFILWQTMTLEGIRIAAEAQP